MLKSTAHNLRDVLKLCAAVLLLAPPAHAATLPATPATLAAVARTAKPCDVIAITGATGGLEFNNPAPTTPTVTFPVSDACPWGVTFDLSGNRLPYVSASKVANLKIKGGAFSGGDWHGAVYVSLFSNVTLEGDPKTPILGNISLREGTGAAVSNWTLIGGAIYLGGVSRFDVSHNVSLAADSDGVDLAGSHKGRVHHNVTAHAKQISDEHRDPVQLFNPVPPYPEISTYIEVDHNTAVGETMGFDAWGGADHVWIHDNTSATNALTSGVIDCTNCAVTNNHGSTLPGSAWQGGYIDSRGKGAPIICGNNAEAFGGSKAINQPSCTPAQMAAAGKLVAP